METARVMIVEDKATVAKDCCKCLESLGYQVTSLVASGEEAVVRAEAEMPDIVLMDIHLRDNMDGIEAAKKIHSCFGIPVVFLSAYSDRSLLTRAKRVGSFGYLVKPFEEGELFATLEMALHKAKADAAILDAATMKATATLAGGIAHDYNNLMCVVLGYAELVRTNLGNNHPDAGILQKIEGAAKEASDLAARLLAFARGGAYKMEDINLNRVVGETLRAQERVVPNDVQIICDLEDELWNVKADRAQLGMILTSLSSNATEAIGEEGVIHITTRNINVDAALAEENPGLEPGRCTLLTVEDNGCGMDGQVLTKAFEPFFSTKFQGRGLGLAAAFGIVKNHRGHISLSSEVDKGTVCTIYLPAVESEIKEPVPAQNLNSAIATETILVVDDERALLQMASMVLSSQGYLVLSADCGQAAVDTVREHEGKIDLAILDMSMPDMDGPTAFPLLKQARPEMKVILFSGYYLDTKAQGLLNAGADSFLQKPTTSQQLKDEIRRVLGS